MLYINVIVYEIKTAKGFPIKIRLWSFLNVFKLRIVDLRFERLLCPKSKDNRFGLFGNNIKYR